MAASSSGTITGPRRYTCGTQLARVASRSMASGSSAVARWFGACSPVRARRRAVPIARSAASTSLARSVSRREIVGSEATQAVELRFSTDRGHIRQAAPTQGQSKREAQRDRARIMLRQGPPPRHQGRLQDSIRAGAADRLRQ